MRDDRGWCHDVIWGDIRIGIDNKGWFHDHIYKLCGLESMLE
jgi:hypothetical protein